MRTSAQHLRLWLLAALVATAAASAMAQGTAGTGYAYDNNGNLHVVASCPGVANGYPTFRNAKCGLECLDGYQLVGSACQLTFSAKSAVSFNGMTYSASLSWKTMVPTTTRIRYRAVRFSPMSPLQQVGADPWTEAITGPNLTTDHIAAMTDLYPVADYEYQIGGTTSDGATHYDSGMSFETAAGFYDVGVISYRDDPTVYASCPGQKDLVHIFLDNEDDNNKNNRSGWLGGIGSTRNTMLPFCRINGQKLKPLTTALNTAYEYAVLSLSSTCPSGSVSFYRHFDTEDSNNYSEVRSDSTRTTGANYSNWEALALPSFRDSSKNVRVVFCMFRSSAAPMANFPDLSQPYGVFAPADFARAIEKGWIYTDDEDASTGNGYGSPFPAESQRMVTTGNNTYLYTAQVTCGPGSVGSAGQSCGSCGGRTTCSGACSVATPSNLGAACGCGGIILCGGACSEPGAIGGYCP